MDNIIEKLKLLNSDNKKILVVGNRPLTERFGKIIDSYDYVIRFNTVPYFLKNGNLDTTIYGEKTDMIVLNNYVTSFFLPKKGIPVSSYKTKDISGFKKFIKEEYNKDLVTIIDISDIKTNGYYFKSIIDYGDATNTILKILKKLYNFDDLNDDPKFVLSLGLYTLCFFLINKIKLDIIGFNLADQSYERSYYNCYNVKKRCPNSVYKLKSHSTGFEVNLLNRLYNQKLFKVLDYPSDDFILKKNGCVKIEADKNKLINFHNQDKKIDEILENIKLRNYLKKFTDLVFNVRNSEMSDYYGFYKNERSISLNNDERAIIFVFALGKTTFEYIPESHINNDFFNKVSMVLDKGDLIAYDSRLQRDFKTDMNILVISYTLPDRLVKYNSFIKNNLNNPQNKFLVDSVELNNETPICIPPKDNSNLTKNRKEVKNKNKKFKVSEKIRKLKKN